MKAPVVGSEGTGRLKSEVRSRARQAEGADRGRVRAGGRGRSCNLTPGSTGPGVNTKHYKVTTALSMFEGSGTRKESPDMTQHRKLRVKRTVTADNFVYII